MKTVWQGVSLKTLLDVWFKSCEFQPGTSLAQYESYYDCSKSTVILAIRLHEEGDEKDEPNE